MCRGEESDDRGSGGFAALDTARASAMLHLSGDVSRICPAGTQSKTDFTFIKSKNQLRQSFPKKHSDDCVHLLFPKFRFTFVLLLDAIEKRTQYLG